MDGELLDDYDKYASLQKGYYVVDFLEEEKDGIIPMALVPSNWIESKNGGHSCMWPNNLRGGNSAFLRAVESKLDISNEDYIICPVHIKYGSNSFEKAKEKLVVLERKQKGDDTATTITSDEEGVNTYDTAKKRTSYKSKKFQDFTTFSSDEDELPFIPTISKPRKEVGNTRNLGKKHVNSNSSSGIATTLSSDEDELPSAPRTISNNSRKEDGNTKFAGKQKIAGTLASCGTASETWSGTLSTASSGTSVGTPKRQSYQDKGPEAPGELYNFLGLCTRVTAIEELMKKSYKKLCTLTKKVEDLSSKIDKLETIRSLQISETTENKLLAFEQLKELDTKIKSESAFSEMFVVLSRIGGRHVVECLRNLLKTLIAHSLALTINWSGRNEKNDFRSLKNLIRLLTAVVRNSPKGEAVTQVEIENIIKIWLRSSGDREGGRDKRRSKSSPPAAQPLH